MSAQRVDKDDGAHTDDGATRYRGGERIRTKDERGDACSDAGGTVVYCPLASNAYQQKQEKAFALATAPGLNPTVASGLGVGRYSGSSSSGDLARVDDAARGPAE